MTSPRDRSFTDFDRPYRKGVVLGLSLAEIFIILVFLLLLTLIGLGELWREAEEKIVTIEGLNDNLENTNSKLERENVSQQQEINELKDNLSEAQDNKNFYDRIIGDEDPAKLIEQKNVVIKKLVDTINKYEARLASIEDKFSDNIDKLQKQLEQLKKVLQEKEKQLTYIAQTQEHGKGQDSPCWYKLDKKDGQWREKPLYIFNIRIYDNHLFVKDIPAPNKFYALQKKSLNFDRTKLDKNISFNSFLRAFEPLKKSGHSGKVRDRRCTFYVGLWNETTNDEAYRKSKEDIVEGVFISYRYRNDPWSD